MFKPKRMYIIVIALVLASVGLLLFFSDLFDSFGLCPGINNITCYDNIVDYGSVMLPAVPVFLMSLIAYFYGPRLYKYWLGFSVFWAIFSAWKQWQGVQAVGGLGVISGSAVSLLIILIPVYLFFNAIFLAWGIGNFLLDRRKRSSCSRRGRIDK